MSEREKIIVIGAGIVGASIAYHLARRGADVTVIDRDGMAAGATGKSFAWINANHFKSEAYHRLRYQSLSEYHRLDRELDGGLGLQWCGALCFDATGSAFDQRAERFRALGYAVETISHNRFLHLEPNYGHPPGRALRSALEGCIEPVQATGALIDGATRKGAEVVFGTEIEALRSEGGRLVGVETGYGPIAASRAVVAAGVGAEALLGSLKVDLPMANKPGIMLHSKPIGPVLNHVIWGDRIHMKQQDDGRLVIGEIFSDGGFGSDPGAVAEQMLADARRHLPDVDVDIVKTTIGLRPIPKDGMPAVGAIEGIDGLYAAVMHSGITLAPIVGRMAADELLDGVTFEALDPYRPGRFHKTAQA
jgi:glycine/D-amino acid oxidase-like deaminating enzyme